MSVSGKKKWVWALFLSVSAIVLVLFASPAWSYQMMFLPNGKSLYRPDPGGNRPADTLIPPMSVEMGFVSTGAPAQFETIAQRAFDVWQNVPQATFTFRNLGDQPVGVGCTIWLCRDGINRLIWVRSGWVLAPDALAFTTNVDFDSVTGRVNETDIYINGQFFNFSTSDVPVPGQYDLMSVLVHELGHVVLLDDLYDYHFADSTMYGFGEPGSLKARDLDIDDEYGIRFLYPESEAALPPPGITGVNADGGNIYFSNVAPDQGAAPFTVYIEGFGFVDRNIAATTSISAEIWQGGSMVPSPAVTNLVFNDSANLVMTLDLTAPLATGEYDIMAVNPNGQAGALPRGVQVNSPGNQQPTVNLADDVTYWTVNVPFMYCAVGDDPLSDGDGDGPLTYRWTMAVEPQGSSVALNGADQQCVSFVPVVTGWYALEVEVFDGIVWSVIDGMEIGIMPPAPPPSSGGGGGGGCAVASKPDQLGFISLMLLASTWVVVRRKR